MEIQLIDPQKFEVVKVYSFIEPYTGKSAYVGYYRPYTETYNSGITDDFDKRFFEWLRVLNLNNVQMVLGENIMFDFQKPRIEQIYNGGRPSTKMALTCHGDYTMDEMMQKGKIEGYVIDFKIYWNSIDNNYLMPLGGVLTFDKGKEQYLMETLSKITSL